MNRFRTRLITAAVRHGQGTSRLTDPVKKIVTGPAPAPAFRYSGPSRGPFMTDPNPDFDPDEVDEGEQASVAAAAIAGFTLAQFAFGALITAVAG
jgi:hypothetical protein